MPFSHYAKIKRILDQEPNGWFIKRIDKPTSAKNFNNERVNFTHYYRIYSRDNEPIKYCKFQQIELLARTLKVPVESLPMV
jgi:hypothetical protein